MNKTIQNESLKQGGADMFIVARNNAVGVEVFFKGVELGLFTCWTTKQSEAKSYANLEEAEKIAEQIKGRVIEVEIR